jgi:TPP-dependent trihydroxycyclohexane-1,2-dione (THcHDO) dehydratase
MSTIRLTMAQAIIRFLNHQYVERDGIRQKFFAGCFGIFGHGNVAGIGQALQQTMTWALKKNQISHDTIPGFMARLKSANLFDAKIEGAKLE